MAKYEPPAHIEIAALRAQQAQEVDLMAAGEGTPWEDRGTHGNVGGFFKTAGLSLFKPAKLYALLRRPSTTGDANGFLFGCGIMWSVAVLIDAIVTATVRADDDFDPMTGLIGHAALMVAAPFILYGLVLMATNIFSTVVESELRKGTPRSLATNIFAYAAGPSVLAPLLLPIHPAAGGVVVLLMAIAAIVGARSRMRLSVVGGTIGVLLGTVVAVGIVVGGYFVLGWLWRNVTQ
jgi:hypothetical protein